MKLTAYLHRLNRESGQGALEYIGVIAVAGLIVIAIISAASGFGDTMKGFIDTAIEKVTSAAGW